MTKNSDRALVSTALDVTEVLVEEQGQDGVELPSWLVFDEDGSELVRNLVPLDGAIPDAAVVEMLSLRGCAPSASAMSVVRVDDGDPRVLAWKLNGEARAVSRSVMREDKISDWRRGWVDEFDASPRGQTGTTVLRYSGKRKDLQHLAERTVAILIEQVLSEHARARDVPGLIGFYDEVKEVVAGAVELDLADIKNELPEMLRQMRLGVATTDQQVAVHVFRWKTLGEGKHQFVIAGFDISEDDALATLAIVRESEDQLELTESEAIDPDLLRDWLEPPEDQND